MVLFGNNGRNARLIGTALLLVTFMAGALAGAAVIHLLRAEHPRVEKNDGRPTRGAGRRLLQDEQFAKTIGLTAEQRARIERILDRRDAEARKMWESFQPRMKEFGKSVHEEIAKVLTPDQQKKLDAAIAERRAAFKKYRECNRDSIKTTNVK